MHHRTSGLRFRYAASAPRAAPFRLHTEMRPRGEGSSPRFTFSTRDYLDGVPSFARNWMKTRIGLSENDSDREGLGTALADMLSGEGGHRGEQNSLTSLAGVAPVYGTLSLSDQQAGTRSDYAILRTLVYPSGSTRNFAHSRKNAPISHGGAEEFELSRFLGLLTRPAYGISGSIRQPCFPLLLARIPLTTCPSVFAHFPPSGSTGRLRVAFGSART